MIDQSESSIPEIRVMITINTMETNQIKTISIL